MATPEQQSQPTDMNFKIRNAATDNWGVFFSRCQRLEDEVKTFNVRLGCSSRLVSSNRHYYLFLRFKVCKSCSIDNLSSGWLGFRGKDDPIPFVVDAVVMERKPKPFFLPRRDHHTTKRLLSFFLHAVGKFGLADRRLQMRDKRMAWMDGWLCRRRRRDLKDFSVKINAEAAA